LARAETEIQQGTLGDSTTLLVSNTGSAGKLILFRKRWEIGEKRFPKRIFTKSNADPSRPAVARDDH